MTGLAGKWNDLGVLGMALAGSAAILLAGAAYARGVSRRVAELADVARRLAAGDYGARARAVDGGLGKLGAGLNDLAGRVQDVVRELSRDKARLAAVLDQMEEAVLAVDAAGNVLLANPALSRLFDVDPAAARGRPYSESLRQAGIAELIAEALDGRAAPPREVRLFLREERTFEARSAPLPQTGQTPGAMLVLHDITRLRRLEQVRRDFVANVSHEMRTPLSSIKGYAETLRAGASREPEVAAEFLRVIEDHADRMSKLVDDLLDLSAIESGHRPPRLEAAALGPLCADAARQLAPSARSAGVRIDVRPMDDLPAALADRDQLRQILLNLIDNAVKYNEPGGAVEVSAERMGDVLRVSVRDTGVGIPEADLPRVFERFYRVDRARSRAAGGTGLGLAIVKHLVEAQGGEIAVESRRPGGTTFRVTLPAAV